MHFWALTGVFMLVSLLTSGQQGSLLAYYSGTDDVSGYVMHQQKIDLLIEKLDSKTKKSDRQFLKNVFNITHRQLLKEYDQYAGFGEIFQDGKYDCLTATALYSILLGELGYEHRIIETNYHIFLLVDTEEGQMLMESTDPLDGFEYQADKIQSRIDQYKVDQNEIAKKEGIYALPYILFDEVSPAALTGLLYYNQCVKAFNAQEWSKAIQLLGAAKRYYNSPRITEMENLLIQVVASIELENSSQPSSAVNAQQIAKREN